jgi:hypothetical protein
MALVEQLSNLDIASGFSVDTLTCEESAPAFLHSLLRRGLHNRPEKTAGVLSNMLLFLKQSTITDSRLTSLLHIIQMILSTANPVESGVLAELISAIKHYYLWPRPISDTARDMLQMLSVEVKNPGFSMRTRLFEEVPELTRGYRPHGKERVVHVLVDRNTQFGQRCQSILQSTYPRDVALRELQVFLLCQFFDFSLPMDLNELDLDGFSDDDVASYYLTGLEIVNRTKKMSDDDSTAFLAEKFALLRNYIVARITDARRGARSTTRPTGNLWPALKFDFLPISCPAHEQPVALYTKAQFPYRASSDALLHVFKSYANLGLSEKVTVRIAIAGNDQTLHSVIGGYVAIKAQFQEIMSSVRPVFYFLPMERSYFSNYLCRVDPWYARHVVAMMHGSLRVLPMMASRFGELTNQSFAAAGGSGGGGVGAAAGGGGGVGVVPDGRQRQLTITQGAQVSIDAVLGCPAAVSLSDIPSPSMMMRAELSYYFREARNNLPINIYQCETWTKSNASVTRPFLQRCELGGEAYLANFRRVNGVADDVSGEEVAKLFKTYRFTPTPVSLKMTQMSISGAARQATAVEFRAYQTLLVSSVSWDSSRSSPVNPVDPWVEVYAVEGDAKKRKKLTDKHVYHVSTIDIEADKTKGVFEVLLDGVLYTDLVRIKISLCADPSTGDFIHMPMMSFASIGKVQVGTAQKI